MILTAERIMVRGRAVPQMGLAINAQGKVVGAAPLAQLPRPTHVLAGKILIPGLVDVCASDLAYHPDKDPTPAAYSNRLITGLSQRLARGVTTVGVPHRGPTGPVPLGERFAIANAMLDAARLTGVRLALLDVLNPPAPNAHAGDGPNRCSSHHLEGALSRFDALVHHILTSQNGQVSWAMLAERYPALPVDALTVLRVRLAHLPCLWAPTPSDAHQQVLALDRAGIMDAGFTVLDEVGLNAQASAHIAHHGARHALTAQALHRAPHHDVMPQPGATGLSPPALAHLAGFSAMGGLQTPWHSLRAHSAGGPQDRQARLRLHAATVGGTTALGLRGGALGVGHWADFFTVRLNDPALAALNESANPDDASWAVALTRGAATLQVTDVFVAGRKWL